MWPVYTEHLLMGVVKTRGMFLNGTRASQMYVFPSSYPSSYDFQRAEFKPFCNLIGWHGFRSCDRMLQELGKRYTVSHKEHASIRCQYPFIIFITITINNFFFLTNSDFVQT